MDEQAPIKGDIEQFLNELTYTSALSRETIRGYANCFRRFLNIMPEVVSVDLLTTDMVIEFFKRIQITPRQVGMSRIKTGVKGATILSYRTKLHTFCEWLCRNGKVSHNPITKISPPKVVYEDSKALTEDDIRRIYSAIALYSGSGMLLRRDTFMISLFAFTGLRLGEALALSVHDVDIEKRLLTVRSNTSKSKRIRHIPIHPTLLMHIRDYLKERKQKNLKTQHLIASAKKDEPLSKHGMKHWVNIISEKSGVKFHVHQLRHSFACNLAQQNVNAVKIQKLLGHSSLTMTMNYLRSFGSDELHEDIEKISFN